VAHDTASYWHTTAPGMALPLAYVPFMQEFGPSTQCAYGRMGGAHRTPQRSAAQRSAASTHRRVVAVRARAVGQRARRLRQRARESPAGATSLAGGAGGEVLHARRVVARVGPDGALLGATPGRQSLQLSLRITRSSDK
jgi:hypothetical protein